MYKEFVHFVRKLYQTNDFIPLHAPQFRGNEKQYLIDTIDSTFVSSVGVYVEQFEERVAEYTGAKHTIATVNGTSALHIALMLAGVEPETEVITQSLTFVATCNAIRYCQADPVFVDVDMDSMGLSPGSLADFLDKNAELRDDGYCWNKTSDKKITACLPMHTFGFPVRLDEIAKICQQYHIALVEDAAESLGSYYKEKHTGILGKTAVISFNGNKIITTGGGGMVLTNDTEIANRAKHITTTAKVPHKWAFEHDEVGYNYRLPNLNAALGVAQMELLPEYLRNKREIAQQYQEWGQQNGIEFVKEQTNTKANYWLNTAIMQDQKQRDKFIEETNSQNVMTRPAWTLLHKLTPFQECSHAPLPVAESLEQRIINLPSSAGLA